MQFVKHNLSVKFSALTTVLTILLSSSNTFSYEENSGLQRLELSGSSQAESPAEAAREIQSKELANLAREYTRNLIGDKKFKQQKSLIESRIIREMNRFFPFVQPDQPVKSTDGTWTMKMTVQYSVPSHRQMLIEIGLFNDSSVAPVILPLIVISEPATGTAIRWWSPQPTDKTSLQPAVRKVFEAWHTDSAERFLQQGFLLLKPQATSVPNFFPTHIGSASDLSLSILKQIADWTGATLILSGEIQVNDRGFVSTQLSLISTANGRKVAELSRGGANAGETPENGLIGSNGVRETPIQTVAKDLAALAFDAWSKGRFAVNTYKLIVRGPLAPRQLSEVKSLILNELKEARELRERFFESGRVTFELDSGLNRESIATRLGQIPANAKYQLKFVKTDDSDPLLIDVSVK